MGLKNCISEFSGKVAKKKWLLLLLIGVPLVILSFPLSGSQEKDKGKESQTATDSQDPGVVPLRTGDAQDPAQTGESSVFGSLDQNHMDDGSSENDEGGPAYPTSASPGGEGSYEAQVENRIKNLLRSVDGVGKVDVIVVLKSFSEKVVRIDRSTSSNIAQGKDSGRGIREATNSQSNKSTVLSGSGPNGSGDVPIIEKELSPEIPGIVINAEDGGNPMIKAEISEAVEALFGLPPHKIKVLRRVE